ncbi:THAP domain-containing protein 5-like [Ixodes scapularis]|uniref:THAP domain-containing protein 5-like n=1 Tax=Ixodes scapularis TaxID=6945 RepID=UPI001C38B5CA|nr:THAP domain-containing protein 5-like [Ixodes scapularis]
MGGCCALGCTNHSSEGNRVFKLPKSPRRRKLWLERIKRGVKWNSLDSTYLCEAHFEPSQFQTRCYDGWRKPKNTAVPTIFSQPRGQASVSSLWCWRKYSSVWKQNWST